MERKRRERNGKGRKSNDGWKGRETGRKEG